VCVHAFFPALNIWIFSKARGIRLVLRVPLSTRIFSSNAKQHVYYSPWCKKCITVLFMCVVAAVKTLNNIAKINFELPSTGIMLLSFINYHAVLYSKASFPHTVLSVYGYLHECWYASWIDNINVKGDVEWDFPTLFFEWISPHGKVVKNHFDLLHNYPWIILQNSIFTFGVSYCGKFL